MSWGCRQPDLVDTYIYLRCIDSVSAHPLEHDDRHLRRASEAEREPVAEAARRVEAARLSVGLLLHVRAPPSDPGTEPFEDASAEEADLSAVRVPGEREVVAMLGR